MTKDPHHCRCYFINTTDIEYFEECLQKFGFTSGLQEHHGQLYGYMLRVKDKLQFHVKVMPDGQIESEMEPPAAYPAAHLNTEYSYSAHRQTKEILTWSKVRYKIPYKVPSTCSNPKIKEPDNSTHAAEFAVAGLVGIVAGAIIYHLMKDDGKDTHSRSV